MEQIISSDELINKNIEESNRRMSESFQDQFSSIMSMTSINSQKLENQLQIQGEREAEGIKGNLTQNLSQVGNLSIEEIAESTIPTESGTLSNDTINNLVQVISDLQGVINNLNLTPSPTETPTATQTASIEGVNIENISGLIDDFKTLSSLTWCADWLQCLEKIVEQADTVNKALSSIPEDKKINFGVNNESLENVDKSIQKVKENINAEINLSTKREEIAEQQVAPETQLSPAFLNSFSDFNDKLSSVVDKIDKNTISSESFVSKISEFSENTIKTIDTSFTEISNTTKEIIERPVGAENTLLSLQSSIKEIETGVKEEKPEPLSLKMVENVIKVPPPELSFEAFGGIMPPIAQQMPVVQQIPPIAQQMSMVQPNVQNINTPLTLGETRTIPPIAQQMPTVQSNVQSAVTLPIPPPLTFSEVGGVMPPLFESQTRTLTGIEGETPINASETRERVTPPPAPMPMMSETLMGIQMPMGITPLPFGMETFGFPLPPRERRMGENTGNMNTTTNIGGQLEKPIAPPTALFESIPFLEDITKNSILENVGEATQIVTESEVGFNPLNFENLLPSFNESKNIGTQIQSATIPNNQISNIGSLQNLISSTIETEGVMPIQVGAKETNPIVPNIEDIFIRSQETTAPSLATAVTKLETSTPEATSEMLANSQVEMNQVNFEPLNKTLTSSISTLGDTLKSQREMVSTPTPTETISSGQNETMTQILAMLTKLDETLTNFGQTQKQPIGTISSLGSSMSDSQARMIGRQIASELKDNFAKLYI